MSFVVDVVMMTAVVFGVLHAHKDHGKSETGRFYYLPTDVLSKEVVY